MGKGNQTYIVHSYTKMLSREGKEGKKAKNPKRLSVYLKETYLLSKIKIPIMPHGVVRWIK